MAVVTSVDNVAVKAARKLVRRQARDRAGAFLVEGPAVAEALGHLTRLFTTEETTGSDLARRAREAGAEVVTVSERVLASLSDTVTPQGFVGVARLPPVDLDALAAAQLVVVCWQIRDPGNLGTVLRSADAAGADAVVCTAGSVDPRNPKAVRASAGSLFHLPVLTDAALEAVIGSCRVQGLRVVAADAGGSTLYTDVDFRRPTAIVLGNETHGLPRAALKAADTVTRVPIHGRAESLNLAAAATVLVYEAARQSHGVPAGAP